MGKTTVEDVQAIAKQVQALRERLGPDSPLSPVAFRLAAMCGEIEAVIRANASSAPARTEGESNG